MGDWIVNALTGQLTPSQLGAIQADTSAGVLRAGGSQADAAAAAAEVAGYNANYSGGTATLQDALSGISTGLLALVVVVVVAVILTRKTGAL